MLTMSPLELSASRYGPYRPNYQANFIHLQKYEPESLYLRFRSEYCSDFQLPVTCYHIYRHSFNVFVKDAEYLLGKSLSNMHITVL